MANRSRLSMAAGRIEKKLQQRFPLVFRANELYTIFHKFRETWNLPKSLGPGTFLEKLIETGVIDSCYLDFGAEIFEFYYIEGISVYHLIGYGVTRSYVSHHSALYLWKLSAQEDTIIFVNQEQSAKKPASKKSVLIQEAVDNVFANEQRTSNSIAYHDHRNIVLIKGKATDMLGVKLWGKTKKDRVLITDVERTLIDCVVRPSYASGAHNILYAFFMARQKKMISVEKMLNYLKTLDYIYPYQQSIGLYMELAGNYTEEEMALFDFGRKEINFYLDYAIQEKNYHPRWCVYYPSELDRYTD